MLWINVLAKTALLLFCYLVCLIGIHPTSLDNFFVFCFNLNLFKELAKILRTMGVVDKFGCFFFFFKIIHSWIQLAKLFLTNPLGCSTYGCCSQVFC